MRLRLGINTCFAVKRWPRPEDWAPVVRAVETHGLELHSTFTGLAAYSSNLLLAPDQADRAAALAWYRQVIAWTAAVGGRAAGGHVGCFSVPDWGDPARRSALWDELRGSLGELATDARRAGLAYLMVENLAVAREPSTMAMIRELLTEGDEQRVPIRLCLDVGHMCVPGTSGADRDPYAWLRELGAVAPVVQLQQSDAAGDHHWPFTPQRNAEGRISAERVIEALGQGGVEESALLLEVIPPFEQADDAVLDDLAASVEYWREALARAGVLAD